MTNNFVPPRRSTTVVAFSGLVSLLRWVILAVVLLLLAPYALAYVENLVHMRRPASFWSTTSGWCS